MDIRWKRFSHSIITKVIVFLIAILCFACAVTIFSGSVVLNDGNFGIAFEDSYYLGKDYISDSGNVVESLREIIQKYKSEEYILNGGTITEDEIKRQENRLFSEFEHNSKSYNPNLTDEENKKIFQEVYADKISEIRVGLINEELKAYKATLRRLEQYPGLVYYANDGTNEITNSPDKAKEYFKTFPSYLIFDGFEQKVFPEQIKENTNYFWVSSTINQLGPNDSMYLAYTDEFLYPRMEKWQQNKALFTYRLNQMAGLLLGLAAAFIYLVIVIGRKPEEDQAVHLNRLDRLYNDFNLIICSSLIGLWLAAMVQVYHTKMYELIFPITLLIAPFGLILVLSLVKHLKNGTFLKHTLIYSIFHKLFKFIKDTYDSGSVGVKVILIVIGYPALVAATFFIFPITIGIAAWLALRKVKEFNAIKEGVKRVKAGDIHYKISVAGAGEFGRIASDINTITEGLNKAVANQLKSERLKTELITNVSHDIRTPLTSIITYVDLLKNEKDQTKTQEYLEIIDQKSQRLKTLTEDLFEAAKASSGNIAVNYEEIDLLSLITQGLGELDDKIKELELEFKINYPQDKMFIQADGKLLWRAIENLLSNIFKYALKGSRVYVDILDLGTSVTLIIKNISAYELNISADELMERFKRGDESRSSQGSGLGLSIAKSLIEIQKGSFNIEIDGDLFKAIIQMPK